MSLDYSLQRLMTQQCSIQRNVATIDTYGAPSTDDWQIIATVPCLLTWSRISPTGRGANKTYVDTSREVPIEEGILLLESDVDITEADQLAAVTDRVSGDLIYAGIIEVISVVLQPTHLEVAVIRAHLGD